MVPVGGAYTAVQVIPVQHLGRLNPGLTRDAVGLVERQVVSPIASLPSMGDESGDGPFRLHRHGSCRVPCFVEQRVPYFALAHAHMPFVPMRGERGLLGFEHRTTQS